MSFLLTQNLLNIKMKKFYFYILYSNNLFLPIVVKHFPNRQFFLNIILAISMDGIGKCDACGCSASGGSMGFGFYAEHKILSG